MPENTLLKNSLTWRI